ncbi:iron chelate uptake ABC transporter family permease subunit [Clostridium thermobutyricum]|uniref:ABC transporter permease n=1 Tax=Clostridium thermobutyricum TaxID=29372 RepID=UPI0029424386|nr:iron chelate uptake ABC transporter family permease subunit [Clostridium thermobutyricum]
MNKKLLMIILIILSFLSLFIGVKDIGIKDVFNLDIEKLNILFISRFPRLISILVAGVGMSIAGVIMQQISNNKFVSPTTSATIDSAKLGALFSTIFFVQVGILGKMLISFIFSILGTFIFMKIMKKIKVKDNIFIPLIGITLGGVIGAVTDFIGYRFNLIQNMTSFLQGNFSGVIKGNYELILLSIPLLIISGLYASKFTVIGMGENISTNLGVNFERTLNIGVIIVSIISSLVVITVGSIPFVGLIIPNIISIRKGDNLKNNIWEIGILGGIFLLTCDIIGRLIIYPYEIPINLIVGVIGSFVFLYLIFRGEK